jgi:acyl-CoA reductase-like NAD-dependent aldehyde dehydrogenase
MSAVEFRTHQSLLYIDGAFMPATGAHVAAAQLEDIDKAVTAAHRAFSMPISRRAWTFIV